MRWITLLWKVLEIVFCQSAQLFALFTLLYSLSAAVFIMSVHRFSYFLLKTLVLWKTNKEYLWNIGRTIDMLEGLTFSVSAPGSRSCGNSHTHKSANRLPGHVTVHPLDSFSLTNIKCVQGSVQATLKYKCSINWERSHRYIMIYLYDLQDGFTR